MPVAAAILQDRKPKAPHGYYLLGPDEYKRRRAEPVMQAIDALTPELRALVHEFGWTKVKYMMRLHGHNHNTVRNAITRKEIEVSLSDIKL